MITKDSKVVVLMGGPSTEAAVSRNTGKAIAEALSSLGYKVISMEYDPCHVVENLKAVNAEAVFIALHGKFGEDGTIQSVLELAGIPYTGSGVTSSAITMDKIMSSYLFKQAGIPMAHSKPYYLKDGIVYIMNDIKRSSVFL